MSLSADDQGAVRVLLEQQLKRLTLAGDGLSVRQRQGAVRRVTRLLADCGLVVDREVVAEQLPEAERLDNARRTADAEALSNLRGLSRQIRLSSAGGGDARGGS